jgi:hypothetical protein
MVPGSLRTGVRCFGTPAEATPDSTSAVSRHTQAQIPLKPPHRASHGADEGRPRCLPRSNGELADTAGVHLAALASPQPRSSRACVLGWSAALAAEQGFSLPSNERQLGDYFSMWCRPCRGYLCPNNRRLRRNVRATSSILRPSRSTAALRAAIVSFSSCADRLSRIGLMAGYRSNVGWRTTGASR